MSPQRFLFIFLSGLITFIFLSTRLYNFEYRFGFNYDMEQSANAAYRIIVDKRPMLIGQETSIGGLFVGPFLYYLQAVAMFFGNFNPLSLGYLAIFASFATLVVLFLVVQDLSNRWQALIAAFLYAVSERLMGYDLSSNHQSYIMLLSIIIFWTSVKVFIENKSKFLPLLLFSVALTFHIHFALFLLVPSLVILYFLYRPKIETQLVVYSIILFTIPFLPTILFELRHDFLITTNLLNFTSGQSGFSFERILQTSSTFVSLIIESLLIPSRFSIFIFLILVASFIYLMRKINERKLMITILLMAFFPLILLYFYNGPIPEYYFLPTMPIFIIIASFVIYYLTKKSAPAAVVIFAIIVTYNINKFIEPKDVSSSFAFKNNIVDLVLTDTAGESFNVYYQMPPGINTGYRYLFKWRGREPQENAANLYILEFINPTLFNIDKYLSTFPNKKIQVKVTGFVHIVSVK